MLYTRCCHEQENRLRLCCRYDRDQQEDIQHGSRLRNSQQNEGDHRADRQRSSMGLNIKRNDILTFADFQITAFHYTESVNQKI